MTNLFNRRSEKDLRRQLRNSMPECEIILWSKLKNRQLVDCRFRRQYSVGAYVIDFYSPEVRLGIELDGNSHFVEGARAYDQKRNRFIISFGIRLVRVLNCDVRENLDGVMERLAREIVGRRGELETTGRFCGSVERLYEMRDSEGESPRDVPPLARPL